MAASLRSGQSSAESRSPRKPERAEVEAESEARSHLAIAAASAAVAMHPQTLRKYERAGLLRPGRRTGGSRHYSADDLARLALIKQLAEVRRLNVAGMSLVLAIRDGLESLLDTIDGEDPQHLGKVARARISAIVRLIDDGGPATGE